MTVLEQLLVVQQHDTTADQLRHRRATLPARQALRDLDARSAALGSRRAEAEARRAELLRDQRRVEDELARVEAKRKETDTTLYSGSVRAPRELQALQDELAALARRIDQLENEVLEVLTELEPVESELAELDTQQGAVDVERERATAELAESEAAVDAELAEVTRARDEAAADLSAEHLADYDDRRRRLGGVAVARLVGTSCGGCHLTLSAVEIDRLRKLPAGETVACEECGRLLVR
ncbi:MAG TPA: C4-type zinc ribbon domain-containing protein [Acidimicrobiales bacterium]|nr:C4-type zinc ribbon domain-containing protein [Acidimicrobiales bacterium]